jgi:hypothetical protein
MIRSGLLNKVITLKYPSTQVNDYGEEVITYDPKDNVTTKARVVFNKNDREVINNEIVYPLNLTFTVRSYHTINDSTVINYNNKDYRILSINDCTVGEINIIAELIND